VVRMRAASIMHDEASHTKHGLRSVVPLLALGRIGCLAGRLRFARSIFRNGVLLVWGVLLGWFHHAGLAGQPAPCGSYLRPSQRRRPVRAVDHGQAPQERSEPPPQSAGSDRRAIRASGGGEADRSVCAGNEVWPASVDQELDAPLVHRLGG
jgi:hypothetical protein